MSDEEQATEPGKLGRPPKYKKAFAAQAAQACRAGFIDDELAQLFGVNVLTVHRWKKAHPEFAAALEEGKAIADERVERALYELCIGYEHPAVKILAVSDGQGNGSRIEEVEYTERYKPDAIAIKFWLTNRKRGQWSDRITNEHELGASLEEMLTKSRQIPQPPGPAPSDPEGSPA